MNTLQVGMGQSVITFLVHGAARDKVISSWCPLCAVIMYMCVQKQNPNGTLTPNLPCNSLSENLKLKTVHTHQEALKFYVVKG